MSVLVYVEHWNGAFKKASFEAVSYASKVAEQAQTTCVAITVNATENLDVLAQYGADNIINISNGQSTFDAQNHATIINQEAEAAQSNTIIISNSNNGKMIAPQVAVKQHAAIISNAIDLPSSLSPLKVKRKAFSNKAIVHYSTAAEKQVLTLMPNAFGVKENQKTAQVEQKSAQAVESKLKSIKIEQASGEIPLPEAELVVSGGRGLKGPEHWSMLEDLAKALGAGTACSKPVADMGWRPHHEHVGQTGLAINPELYIAVGISGAIQHLAGVASSKNIVVINTDPEAPFFKAADYGIVGDAFEVIPKLTESIKAYKSNG
ncbi:MAG: electron transfer flavoprotein subunit alpha/FixB family protein [Flavobacteriales bacterium]